MPGLSYLVPFWYGVLFRFVSRIALSGSKTLQHHKLFIVTEALQCSTSTLNFFFFQARHLCDLHPISPAPTLSFFFFFITSVGARPGRGIYPVFLSPLVRVFVMVYIYPSPRNLSTYLPGMYSRTRWSTFKECEICPYIQKKKAISLSQI